MEINPMAEKKSFKLRLFNIGIEEKMLSNILIYYMIEVLSKNPEVLFSQEGKEEVK